MNARVAIILETSRRRPGRVLITTGLILAVAGLPLVFSPDLYDNFTLPKQSLLLLAAALALVGSAVEGRFLPANRWLRFAFVGWVATLVLSWALGIDPLGSVLGYYQYRQGLLTQLSYAILFAAAIQAGQWLSFEAFAIPASGSLGLVAVYAGLQTSGHDPFSWWIDASSRAISTIGNANELAAYAVIALAFAGSGERLGRWQQTAIRASVAAASGFIVFAAQSRSGLGALAIVVLALGAIGAFSRWPVRQLAVRCGTLAAGCAAGCLLAALVATSGSDTAASRVEDGIAKADPVTSTRVQLWRGAAKTFAASPIVGFGPDGLYRAFPLHRPADLHGAFDGYDLVAQSSHNWVLDTAANAGIAGLAALGTVLAAAVALAARSFRRPGREHSEGDTWVVAAICGYAAITMANPLSLAAHTTFFVVAGFLAGKASPAVRSAPRFRRPVRLAILIPAALAMVVIAVLLPVADLRAQSAWERYAHEQFAEAAREASGAQDLMPFEQTYLRREANAWLAAGARGDQQGLSHAEAAFRRMDDRFGLTSLDAIGLATARIGLEAPHESIDEAIDRMVALNPHGVFVAWYSERLRRAAAGGAILHYDSRDDWVRVDFPADIALP